MYEWTIDTGIPVYLKQNYYSFSSDYHKIYICAYVFYLLQRHIV